jgi:hypothetical protein
MAIKKMTSAKKPVAKMATKAKSGKKPVDYVPSASAGKSNPASAMKGKGSLPKSATMKSRGSKTAKQMGDMNQREWYNARRGQSGTGSKATYAEAVKSYSKDTPTPLKGKRLEQYEQQRAGGSKNLTLTERKAKAIKAKGAANAKGVANKPKGPLKKKSNPSAKLQNLNAQGKPKQILTRGSRDTGQVGDQNMRENYNASRGSKMPRVKQLSSYKKDGGASRRFARAGGKGK